MTDVQLPNAPPVLSDDPAQLEAAVAAKRRVMGQLTTQREAHEKEFAEVKAQYDVLAARLSTLRQSLLRSAQERSNLVREMDELLQHKARIDNARRSHAAPGGVPPPAPPRLAAPPPAAPPPPAPPSAVIPLVPKPAAAPSSSPTDSPKTMDRPPAFGAQAPERRIQPRVPLAVEVDFRGETNLWVGFSENVSEGGLFVATYSPRAVGEKMALQFSLPGQSRLIYVDAEVAWAVPYRDPGPGESPRTPGFGVRFTNLSEADRQLLMDFITQREPLFFAT